MAKLVNETFINMYELNSQHTLIQIKILGLAEGIYISLDKKYKILH